MLRFSERFSWFFSAHLKTQHSRTFSWNVTRPLQFSMNSHMLSSLHHRHYWIFLTFWQWWDRNAIYAACTNLWLCRSGTCSIRTTLRTHHYYLDPIFFITSTSVPINKALYFHPASNPCYLYFVSPLWICLLQRPHVSGITNHLSFCVCLVSLSTIYFQCPFMLQHISKFNSRSRLNDIPLWVYIRLYLSSRHLMDFGKVSKCWLLWRMSLWHLCTDILGSSSSDT